MCPNCKTAHDKQIRKIEYSYIYELGIRAYQDTFNRDPQGLCGSGMCGVKHDEPCHHELPPFITPVHFDIKVIGPEKLGVCQCSCHLATPGTAISCSCCRQSKMDSK